MKEIYEFLNVSMPPQQEDRIKKFLAQHKQDRFGRHRYRLEDFTTEDILERPVFKEYVERFKL